jgi:trigger factor
MNITHEATDELTATIKIEIQASDYQEEVEKKLKDLRRKANIPGFRPGHIPLGMIRKMYGKSVLFEEINKRVSESLDDYIKKNDLKVLGTPLANTEKSKEIDFDNEKDFEFYFDIGMTPHFELELSDQLKANYYQVKIEDQMIDDRIKEYQYRFGTSTTVPVVGENDVVKGDIVELDEAGKEKENGIHKSTSLSARFSQDPDIKAQFLGATAGQQVVYNPMKATESAVDTASMLGIAKEEAEHLESMFRFTISEISHFEPLPVDAGLFNKVYPNHSFTSEEEFRLHLRNDLEASLLSGSERLFMTNITDLLIQETNINLPEAFLKRYLLETGKEEMTMEQIEADFDRYARSLRWQLIENKLIKNYDLAVTDVDIRTYIRNYFSPAPHEHEHEHEHSGDTESEKRIELLVNMVMENKEEVEKINDYLYDNRLRTLLKSKLSMTTSVVSYEEFIKFAAQTK